MLLESIETYNRTFLKIAVCDTRDFGFDAAIYDMNHMQPFMEQP